MYSIFKQSTGSRDVYSKRELTANPHYVSIGGGLYVNKTYPDILPMQEVASNVEDADAAIELLIQLSKLQGRDAVRVSSQQPLVRIKVVDTDGE